MGVAFLVATLSRSFSMEQELGLQSGHREALGIVGHSLTLDGVTRTGLHASDFIFALGGACHPP
jgi:hypothetical protein